MVYSLDEGLESLLHRFKDFGPEYRWIGALFGSLAIEFFTNHLQCIEERYGKIDIFAVPPAGGASRNFDHMAEIIHSVRPWRTSWDLSLLKKKRNKKDERGQVDTECYDLSPGRGVEGKRVLFLDDTWTSGSTLASAAAAAKRHGAQKVVAVTIGRQLKKEWGTGRDIAQAALRRRYDVGRCVICA
ncbi:ComF family protein [Actinomadura adrarensis]|uniref:ComF family protein n=1 Tax=Actinomadura adrarensis TaxID=1819600 RepID=A0ABW3CBM0_9ACTN